MAYWINHIYPYNNSSSRQIHYLMDGDGDLSNLPTSQEEGTEQGDTVTHKKCGKGSVALAIASGKKYILDSTDTWTEVGSGSEG